MEVTILLSNTRDDKNGAINKKVITLKSLSEFRQQDPDFYKEQIDSNQWDIEKQITNQKAEMKSLESKKAAMLQDMKTAIQKEKQAWLVTKEEERKQAQEVGYKTGYDAGLEQAEKEYAALIEEANDIVEAAKRDYFQTIEKHEAAIIQLAITTAKKITKQQIAQSDTGITDIIKHAIVDLKERSNLSIYVHPADYDYVLMRKEELEELLEDGELISIHADDRMNQGDCVIKHPYGELEIGIDVQLKQIKAALEEKITENQ